MTIEHDTDTVPPPDGDTVESLTAELERWKGHSRTWEDRAKQNRDERDDVLAKLATIDDAAIEAARADGRSAGAFNFALQLVDVELRTAAAGRPADVVEALREGINGARFINEDGTIKTDELVAWVERVAPIADVRPVGPPEVKVIDLRDVLGVAPDPFMSILSRAVGQ